MRNREDASQCAIRNIMTRDFVLGFLAFFIFFVANFALTPTMPIYLKTLGSSAREIGGLVGIFGIASLVCRLLVGAALRKYPEKRVMMFGAVLFAFTFLAFIALRPFWPLLAVRFFQGVAFSCMDTAAIAYVISAVPLAYRTRAISYIFLAPSLAMTVAAPFGMLLMNRYGFTVLLFTGTALSACAFFFSLSLSGRGTIAPGKEPPVKNTLLFEWKIIAPAITSFLQYVVWSSVSAFFPLYAVQCGVRNPGLFFSAMAFMMIMGRIFGGKVFETWRKERIIVTFMLMSMAALVILSLSRTLPMFIFVGLLWGIAAAFVFPTCMAYALDYAGASGGTALGTYQAFTDLGMALGPVVTGIMIPLAGYRKMFLCLAFICILNLCYSWFCVWTRHNATQMVRPTP
ncbi:MAG: MFS transporter [Syntrophorhabdaceae bacterium]|nr:MFS transporter [Syntrophorhabdaceae bacterium]